MASVEPMRLKSFLRPFRPLVVLWALPFAGLPLYYILTGQDDLGGWLGLARGIAAAICIPAVLSLLLVRRWGTPFYIVAFLVTAFTASKIGNTYTFLSTVPLTIISNLIYNHMNRKAD